MSASNPYLEYWQKRQKEQREYHQKLAQEARKKLPPVIDYLKENFPITKIILFGSLIIHGHKSKKILIVLSFG